MQSKRNQVEKRKISSQLRALSNLLLTRRMALSLISAGVVGATINHTVAIHYAPEDSFPWQVFVYTSAVECGGVIVAKDWVLTAAHCVENKTAEEVRVVLADKTPADDSGIQVAEIIKHPKFPKTTSVRTSRPYDVALLNLEFPPLRTLPPIKLVEAGHEGFPQDLVVAGWACNSPVTEALNWLTFRVFDCDDRLVFTEVSESGRDQCDGLFGKRFSCAGGRGLFVAGIDEGDSGGGLTTVMEGDSRLVGIANIPAGKLDGYARIAWHSNWINDCLSNKNSNQCRVAAQVREPNE
ncbi:MAG TPA: trypsin-like serine protease [Steroidobacteraceae bacterium]|nr:trypsin-like serine protease [Steroidobacteraceae bacterium]